MMSEFISVEDKLPEYGVRVDAFARGKRYANSWYAGEKYGWEHEQYYGSFHIGGVTHWMPLPGDPPVSREAS